VAERGPEEIRREIAVERGRLEESRDALLAELRSFVPVIVAGLVALGVLTARRGFRTGVRRIQKLS
jgi:hypothetical protein